MFTGDSKDENYYGKDTAVSQSDKDFQREIRRRDKEFQMEMRGISGEMDVPSSMNHGLISLILFVATAGVYIFGMVQTLNAIGCIMVKGEEVFLPLRIGSSVMIASILLLIAALATAGMSLASGNGKVMGIVVLAITALPILWLIFTIWFGAPMDSLNMGGTNVTDSAKATTDAVEMMDKCK